METTTKNRKGSCALFSCVTFYSILIYSILPTKQYVQYRINPHVCAVAFYWCNKVYVVSMKSVVYQNQEDNIPIDDNFMKYNTAEQGTKQASRLSSTKPQHHNQISSSSAALWLAIHLTWSRRTVPSSWVGSMHFWMPQLERTPGISLSGTSCISTRDRVCLSVKAFTIGLMILRIEGGKHPCRAIILTGQQFLSK